MIKIATVTYEYSMGFLLLRKDYGVKGGVTTSSPEAISDPVKRRVRM